MKYQRLIQDIRKLEKDNDETLHLTANENILSDLARSFLSSRLSERYYSGGGVNGIVSHDPFKIKGLESVEHLINESEQFIKTALGAKHVNMNCLSGMHAMLSVLVSVSDPGDVVMTISVKDGGHFATLDVLNLIGRKNVYLPINERREIVGNKLKQIIVKRKVKVLYLDPMYYLDPIDLKHIRRLVGKEVLIVYDASHTLGLMLGGQFQSPLKEGADIISANTHKTFPGPHKAIVAFKNKDLGIWVSNKIAGKLYSTVHTNALISLAVSILEMQKFGKSYAKQVIKNANALGKAFEAIGYEVARSKSGAYTNNHQIHIFIDNPSDVNKLYSRLIKNNISTNFDATFWSRPFIRFGAQEITRRGMKEAEMTSIADFVNKALTGLRVKPVVHKFVSRFKETKYSFDHE